MQLTQVFVYLISVVISLPVRVTSLFNILLTMPIMLLFVQHKDYAVASLNGWGRSTWGSAAWGSHGTLEVTGVEAAGAGCFPGRLAYRGYLVAVRTL